MTRASDIERLVAIRALREERARILMAGEAARLRASERATVEAEAAIEAHDAEADERERRFLEVMNSRPLSGSEVGRSQHRFGLSDHRREALSAERDAASRATVDQAEQLDAARGEWRQRLQALDKLKEVQTRLAQAERIRAEAAAEGEAEDMSAERPRPSC